MPKCDRCGRRFDRVESDYQFVNEYPGLSFDNLNGELCFDCACRAMEAEESGIFFETCEECGKQFDFIEDRASLANDNPAYLDAELQFVWNKMHKTLCADCATSHLSEVYYTGNDAC